MAVDDFTDLATTPTLPGCSASEVASLLAAGDRRKLDVGEHLIEQGAGGDEAYLIIDGEFQVSSRAGGDDTSRPVRLRTLEPGTMVGATALISAPGTERNATVTAATPATVVVVDRQSFDALTASNDELTRQLATERDEQLAERRLLQTPLYPLFISDRPVADLTRRFEPDEPLMVEGENADGVYIIASGSVSISKTIDGLEIRLGDVLAGGVVGELGVLDGASRSATVRATTDTNAYFIDRDRLTELTQGTHAYFATLRRLYELPDRGLVSQNFGEFEGSVAIRTSYDMPEQRQVVCHSIADRDLHHALALRDGQPGETVTTWTWSQGDDRIEVGIDSNNVPIEARLQGATEDFRLLYRCVMAGLPVPPETGETLEQSGRFELDRRRLSRLDDDEVCTCMGVTELQINRVVRTYAPDLEKLQDMLGCGTVCGSCIDDVEDLLT